MHMKHNFLFTNWRTLSGQIRSCLNGHIPPPSSPPPSATAIQNIIPTVFHGEHSDGPRLWDISARSLVNYDGGKYIVKEVVLADGGKICVVTVKSPTEQDVITLRQTSKGKIIVTSRMLDDEWQRYEEEGGEAPD